MLARRADVERGQLQELFVGPAVELQRGGIGRAHAQALHFEHEYRHRVAVEQHVQLVRRLARGVLQRLPGLGVAKHAFDDARVGLRLEQVVLGARGDGALAQAVVLAAGQHHHRQVRMAGGDPFQAVQAVAVGQAQVEQDRAVATGFKHGQGGFQRRGMLDRAWLLASAQQRRIQQGIAARVIHQEDGVRARHCGKRNPRRDPRD